jgi:hypothetical protein
VFRLLLLTMLLIAPLVWADLSAVKNEQNLEKRSEKALEYANMAIDEARKAYKASDLAIFKSLINEVEESAELSYKSLADTG